MHVARVCMSGLQRQRSSEAGALDERGLAGGRGREQAQVIASQALAALFFLPEQNQARAPGAAGREAGWRLWVKGRWARASPLHGLASHSHPTT